MENEFEFIEHNPGVDTDKAMRGYEKCESACYIPIFGCQDSTISDSTQQAAAQLVRQNNLYWNQALFHRIPWCG